MKWKGRRESSNVEDRRGIGGKTIIGGGIGSIIIVLLFTLLGGNPGDIMNNMTTNNASDTNTPYQETAKEKEQADFVSVVLADTEDIWSEEFKKRGLTYENPKLVLYSGSVQSACGSQSAAVGPFYCPGDHKLYIDLSFYQELKDKFQAPGDFAMAYVIAHEVGHHVQTLLHSGDQVSAARKRTNEYSVRYELQADYLAGVWAHYAQGKGYLEKGDLEEALNAANSVGDDNIQKKAQGYVVPESFTHGSSEQRMRWFNKGFKTGTIEGGDTFNAANL
ncbi:metalloprotease [Bacillus sp. AFS076308]|uniref:KPN_02809 family neutral zinc metallopeptidase n=1 Tax=unclassified Bacillus (in: firmicutes) TaxID=185979 RepID=UPI000BF41238|nr:MULTISPECIES: neutral zinc metallopeptidase [unclassified Bacillus (in: firmicutes)]PFN95672.1 metalloprotease [Bacillus sp. AFS076308]PGV55188.1 metalloprotease [Bacillus sp. AFS037270]